MEIQGSGGPKAKTGATPTASTVDEVVARAMRHLSEYLRCLNALEPGEAAKVLWSVLVEEKWSVAQALRHHLDQPDTVRAPINWLQEIEASAMDLLEVLPDLPEEFDFHEQATLAATRIFSRVRLILPTAHSARSAGARDDVEIDSTDNEGPAGRSGVAP